MTPGEEAFLNAIAREPDDDVHRLVYADWLQDDDHPRAEFLRVEVRMSKCNIGSLKQKKLQRRLSKLAKEIDARWLVQVSRPCLIGTSWAGTDSDNDPVELRFQADGTLHYLSSGVMCRDGFWKQMGAEVLIEVNNKYATYRGIIHGDRLEGVARNVAGHVWTWQALRHLVAEAQG